MLYRAKDIARRDSLCNPQLLMYGKSSRVDWLELQQGCMQLVPSPFSAKFRVAQLYTEKLQQP